MMPDGVASGQPLVVSSSGQLIVSAGDDIFLRVPGTLSTSNFLSLTSLAATGGFVSLSSGAVTVDGGNFALGNDSLQIIATDAATGDITINSELTAGSVGPGDRRDNLEVAVLVAAPGQDVGER